MRILGYDTMESVVFIYWELVSGKFKEVKWGSQKDFGCTLASYTIFTGMEFEVNAEFGWRVYVNPALVFLLLIISKEENKYTM